MKTLKLILLTVLMGGMVNAAEETQKTDASNNTSSAKISDMQKSEEKQKDIDDEITNARQRAALGSKSKFSFKSALNYNGGSVNKPADKIRPAYRAANNVEVLTSIAGTIGMNYRMTESDSLSFNTGLLVRNPFHGRSTKSEFNDPRKGKENKVVQKYEVSDPSLAWSRAYKAGSLQMVTSSDFTYSTNSDSVNTFKQVGSLSLSQTIIGEVGTSLSLGASIGVDTYFHRAKLDADVAAKGYQQELLTFGIYPFLEYAFNDTFQFRTVFGYFANTYYKDVPGGQDKGRVEADTPYQSMGLGIVVTRDIYLYPNIQFTPLDIRGDRTNVALSTNINLF